MADEVRQLLESSAGTDSIITEKDTQGLLEPVQRNLRYAGIIGKQRINTVRLKQKGLFKMKQGRKWMPYVARQYFTTDPPGFVWQARVKAAPLFWISGRDMYYGGKGSMKIKLWSFIRIVNAAGPKLDQGAMLRYLSEIVWFPTAYLSDYITWEAVDANSAKATMSYGDVTSTAVLHYDEEGRLVSLFADRYKETDDNAVPERWSTPVKEYAEMNGLKVPVKAEAVWNLASGDFTYIDLEVTDIEYNNPAKC